MTQHLTGHKDFGLLFPFKKRLNDIDAYNEFMFLFIYFSSHFPLLFLICVSHQFPLCFPLAFSGFSSFRFNLLLTFIY